MIIKLSILVCRIPSRYAVWQALLGELVRQIKELGNLIDKDNRVQVLSNDSTSLSIGEKRNKLLNGADGEYVCFIDDDDSISRNYISLLLQGIDKGVDCCSLKGMYSVNGVYDGIFEHPLMYKSWQTTNNEIKYERYPNHLNCIKASIAKQFKFPEKNFGEDHDWSKQLHESGLLKTEHNINQVIYFYRYITKK